MDEKTRRKEMVLALTRAELDWYVNNRDGKDDYMARFFACGGFDVFSTKALENLYAKLQEV